MKLQKKENQTDHWSPITERFLLQAKVENEKYESEWKKKICNKSGVKWFMRGVVERKTAKVTWLVTEPVSEAMIGWHVENMFMDEEWIGR